MAQTEELFTSELRQLKELTALENLLVLSQQNGLKARVHAVQNSSVNRLIVLLKLAPTDEESVKIAQRFLTQLQNFSELYLQDTQKVGDDATERMDELFNENQSKLDEIITDQLLQDSEASGDSQVTPVELEFNHLDSFGGEHS
jgi:S-adenosylmethionine:tRNA-ribosyltransferase-isomerase (queuine synthetase)